MKKLYLIISYRSKMQKVCLKGRLVKGYTSARAKSKHCKHSRKKVVALRNGRPFINKISDLHKRKLDNIKKSLY